MRRITSRHNPAVARYRAAQRGDPDGEILLDGAHLVLEALEAGAQIREAAVVASAVDQREIRPLLDRLLEEGADVCAATAGVMNAISPVRSPSPIVALASRPRLADADIFQGASPFVVATVDVQDPGNVGAIIRVAEAGGATGVIVAGASADPFGWRALRGSMGSALRVPLCVKKGAYEFDAARRHGCRVVATAPRGGRSVFDANLTGPLVVVIGGEGRGLPEALLRSADDCVTVPMQAPVDSLNAAVTAALIVYEARRQRA
jgi:TrmH family RNA methyltransferase